MARTIGDLPHRPATAQQSAETPTESLATGVPAPQLPQEMLEQIGGQLTAQAWLNSAAASRGMRAVLHAPAVVRAVMAEQRTPPPVIHHLLPPGGDVAAAVAHVAAKQALWTRLATQPAEYLLSIKDPQNPRIVVHPDGLGFLQWSRPKPHEMAQASHNLQFTRLDAATAQRSSVVRLGAGVSRREAVCDAVFSADGRHLFVATATGSLVRLQRDDSTGTFGMPQPLRQGGLDPAEDASLVLSPGGKTLLWCRHQSGTVAIVDVESDRVAFEHRLLRQPRLGDYRMRRVAAFLSEGDALLVDNHNGVIRLRITVDHKVKAEPAPIDLPAGAVLSLHQHPAGGAWLEQQTITNDDRIVSVLIDSNTLQPIEGPAFGPMFNHGLQPGLGAQHRLDGAAAQRVLAGGAVAARWSRMPGPPDLMLFDRREAAPRQLALPLLPQYGNVEDVVLSPNVRHLAVAQGARHLWLADLDETTPVLRQVGPPQRFGVPAPQFSPDGSLLLSQDGRYLRVHTTAF